MNWINHPAPGSKKKIDAEFTGKVTLFYVKIPDFRSVSGVRIPLRKRETG